MNVHVHVRSAVNNIKARETSGGSSGVYDDNNNNKAINTRDQSTKGSSSCTRYIYMCVMDLTHRSAPGDARVFVVR